MKPSALEHINRTLVSVVSRLDWLEKEVHGLKGVIHEARAKAKASGQPGLTFQGWGKEEGK